MLKVKTLFLSFLPVFLAAAAFAQQPANSVTLEWKGYEQVLPIKGRPDKVPTFSNATVSAADGLPVYVLQFANQAVSDFRLVNPVYEAFSAADAKLLPKDFSGAQPRIEVSSGYANRRLISTVSITPVRKNPSTGQLEKLVKFSYQYSKGSTATAERRGGNKRLYAKTSVLSSGEWYKIGVTGTGIHKIDKTTLQALGIHVQNVNPRNLQLYGNGGGMLPQANSAPRHDDLVENAIFVAGENDGKFDDHDYILFFAQGPDTWHYDASLQQFRHSKNIYSDTAFYFIALGNRPGLRVQQDQPLGISGTTINTYNEHWFHENDLRNVLKSGRQWFGEEFNNFTPSRDFNFQLPGLVAGSTLRLTSEVMGNAPDFCSFQLTVNGRSVGPNSSHSIGGRGNFSYHAEGVLDRRTFSSNLDALNYNGSLNVNLRFSHGNYSTTNGFLNYLEFNALRHLQLYGNQTTFRSVSSVGQGAISTFTINNTPGTAMVWDVTNPLRPRQQPLTFSGSFANFTAKTDSLRQFIVFNGTDFGRPVPFGRVANQNLHSLNQLGDVDLVIVTHPSFLGQANRLADHRRNHTNMQVEVVTTSQIYNEFSSGAQDITAIRDFMRMIYDRIDSRAKGEDSLLYLVLLGDASYDYKDYRDPKKRNTNNTNFVPVYESYNSLDPIYTFSSDDYFGFMDDNEGEWNESGGNSHLLDIGIGRLPARNAAEAEVLVNKIISYDSPNNFGKWRNRVAIVTDDGEKNGLMNDGDRLATYLDANYPLYNISKLYLDLFPQIAVANGQRSPAMVAAIDKAVEQGSLLINYVGHGGETGWTSEQILTISQINNWKNSDRLAFFLTATCEFGRYDDPARASGAEYALYNPSGGAIGLITTTRPVYQHSNYNLNEAFFNIAFVNRNNRRPRLGEIMAYTKNFNKSNGELTTRNFALLGDPSMRLAYPELEANVLKVNGNAPAVDTLKALSKVTIEGNITANSQQVNDFNGQVQITVYEKEGLLRTLGDEADDWPTDIRVRENIIYDGVASVRNGTFTASFVVPKDISYNFGTGKISLYAFDRNNRRTDAGGYENSILIGGSLTNQIADTEGPKIRSFMNDESFVNGGLTAADSRLLMLLEDSSGINTAGIGIGHEITATLDGNKENVYILNDYYTAEVDSYQKGRVLFPFKNLANGPHSLRLKAWDTHNNSSEDYLEFIVANDEDLVIKHVLNYPNPFSTNTTFHFDHNRSGEDLDIMVQIFTVSGKLIRTLSTTSFASKAHVAELNWNGRDDFNDVLARGVYVYKVTVKSLRDGSKTDKFEKLVILN